VGLVDEGQLSIETDDGQAVTIPAGNAYVILPGHKAKVLGTTHVVLYEFDSIMNKIVVPHPPAPSDETAFDGVLAVNEEPVVSHNSFESSPLQSSAKDDFALTSTLEFESARIIKTVAKPGFNWKDHIRPILDNHKSCEHTTCVRRHVGFLKAGLLHITMDSGQQKTIGPGDSFVIEPGHQAMVPGSDDMVRHSCTC
jgi:uncharacterized cupin superfamily protein